MENSSAKLWFGKKDLPLNGMTSKSDAQSFAASERIYLHIYDYETKEFSGLTTYHGLVRIYNSNTWPSRIFWCVVVLCCLSLFMIHSGYLLLGYHSKPTLFQINTLVAENGMLFPDITICNYNLVQTSNLKRYNMDLDILSYVLAAFNEYGSMEERPEKQELFDKYLTDYSIRTGRNFSIVDFFTDIRPSCEETILSCSFAGEVISDCCSYTETVLTDIGICIRFPSPNLNKTQYLSGSSYGWQFILNGNNAGDSEVYSPPEMGFRVLVHERGKEYALESRGLSVPPGAALHAGISVRNVSLLQRSEWGFCQRDWNPQIHGNMLSERMYTATHCQWNCLANGWLLLCGCLPMKLLALGNLQEYPICMPNKIQQCVEMVYENTTDCKCDVECQVIEYEMQMSYSDIVTNIMTKRFKVIDDYARNNISVVNLYLQSMVYERHEQQKQLQTADLLSNIAGSMGLFLGMSTITLLEIFIYLFKAVWGTVNTERQKQFMEAMMEEENERRQSLVIVEEPQPEQPSEEEEPKYSTAHFRRRHSKRVSVVPLHIHLDRRGSTHPHLEHQIFSNASVHHHKHLSPRKSLAHGLSSRRYSTMETTLGDILPNFHTKRKSIAVGTLQNKRNSVMEGAGEILPTRRRSMAVSPHSHRRPSTVLVAGPSGRRLSVQQNDDAIHLALMNRRRSSLHPKHFLI